MNESELKNNYEKKVKNLEEVIDSLRKTSDSGDKNSKNRNINNELTDLDIISEENPYPVLRIENDGTIMYANPGSNILLNYWLVNLRNKIVSSFYEKLNLAFKTGKNTYIEVQCNDIIYSLFVVPVNGTNYANIYGRDITNRKKIEADLNKVTRMYAFLSQVDQTIVRVNTSDELFEKISIDAIGYGKFSLAFIGRVDYENKMLIPLKHASILEGYLNNINYTLNENVPEGKGPVGRAVRARKTIVYNNILEEDAMAPWKENAKQFKYNSIAAIPFFLDDIVFGVLVVIANEIDFFSQEEIKLLEEISSDISYALNRIKIEKEKKEIQNKLIESEIKYRTLINEIPLGIITCDINGNIEFVNKAMLGILGSPSEEATKAINLLHFPPLKQIGFPDLIKECIQKEQKVVGEKEYLTKWGKKIFLLLNIYPLFDSRNIVTGIIILSMDITERFKVEEELKKSEEKFRIITETAPYPISIFNNSGEYLYMNPKFTEFFGYTMKEMPTRAKWFELIYPDPEYRNQVKSNWKKATDLKDESKRNFIVQCKDGTKHSIVFFYYPIDKERNLMFNFDITEHKEHEQELIKSVDKAEQSEKIKSAFIAGLSHEIRTPMNAIIGFTDLLIEETKDLKKKKEYAELLELNGNLLLGLIDDIIDFSKIESGILNISISDCHINDLLDELFKQYKEEKNKLHKNEVKLICNKEIPDRNFIIQTDAARLKQVLSNLLNNAVKFTDKGHIEFGYKIIDEDGREKISFYVEDTGIGIKSGMKENIFESFKRFENKFTKKNGSSGLGLVISKKLIDKLGGKISVNSEEGQGSTFTVVLDCSFFLKTVNNKIDVVPHKKKEIDWTKINVLVAEDDKNNLKYFNFILQKVNAKIINAANGQEAVEIYKKFNSPSKISQSAEDRIDIILMDIQMPVLNGFEATKQIKKIDNEIPILALTAYAMPEERQLCHEAGCDEYISKPVKGNELLAKMEFLLTNK